jgi:hypothetical protein
VVRASGNPRAFISGSYKKPGNLGLIETRTFS